MDNSAQNKKIGAIWLKIAPNHVEVAGFEPAAFWSRTKRATKLRYAPINGANEGARTLDLRITNALLCQLSYIGLHK